MSYNISILPRRVLLVLSTSVILAVVVTWASLRAEGGPSTPVPAAVAAEPGAVGVSVLIAAEALAEGVELAPDRIKAILLPEHVVGEDFLRDTETTRRALTQMRATRAIPKDTPFVHSDLRPLSVKASDPTDIAAPPRAADRLASGMRAISVPLTRETSISGLIAPEDRVDIMVSYGLADGVRAVRTVLAHVRVVAIDGAGGGNAGARMITLELHPEGAKVLALAQGTGNLVFVLSPPGGGGLPRIASDVPLLSTQISGQPEAPARPVTVFRGQAGLRGEGAELRGAGIVARPVDHSGDAVAPVAR
ncbi:Flp pilus assembly protein CpaB [Ponticoccus sp. (in: a-proteobacteria)]|uniref:Flp pilus assembly protein CpaB n=1 Tax=Ponticoccus sp. (in: a-proteobacteria) TaxID=1925025 RepID=UPI003AB611E8